MSEPVFVCPCCGHGTPVIASIEEVAERFTGHRLELIRLLSSGRWMTRDALFMALYGRRADGGPSCLNIISVKMHQIKKELLPFGYTIASTSGGSYAHRVYRIAPIAMGASA